jgi:hypothetical protein
MPIIIDNDGVNFCQEFRELCKKYVKEASLATVHFKDGTTIGMRTLWQIGLGVKRIEDVI